MLERINSLCSLHGKLVLLRVVLHGMKRHMNKTSFGASDINFSLSGFERLMGMGWNLHGDGK